MTDAPAITSGTLVIATTNPGKIREIVAILADAPFELRTLADFPAGTRAQVVDGAGYAQKETLVVASDWLRDRINATFDIDDREGKVVLVGTETGALYHVEPQALVLVAKEDN